MSITRYEGAGTVAIPSEQEWGHLERMAKMIAASAMCPKAFKQKPAELMVVAMSLREVDVPFTLNTLKQCYVIDGQMEMMAQLKTAIAARHGWDIFFVAYDDKGQPTEECDDTHAIVHYIAPGKPERLMEYKIDEARKNGLLDEWVEKKTQTGAWPDGNKKYDITKFTVSVDGQPIRDELPDWAAKEKAEGRVKRKDPWFKSRESMLMARAITKALRYAAPHLLLGIGDGGFDPAPEPDEIVAPRRVVQPQAAARDEDPIDDAEIVEHHTADSPGANIQSGPEFAAGPGAPGGEAPPTVVDADWVQRFAIGCRNKCPDGLTADEFRHGLVFTATGGRTESSKAVIVGDESRRAGQWFAAVTEGTEAVMRRRTDGTGYEAAVVTYAAPEEEPF